MSRAGRTREAELAVVANTSVWQQLWSLAREDATTGCWIVDGFGSHPYARISVGTGEAVGAHRLSWILTRGPIPLGLHVAHRCDRPRCIRPAHLFVGTARDNVLDAVRKGRVRPPVNVERTHCRKGHAYTGYREGGTQRCVECKREANRASYQRRRQRKAA